MSGFLPTSECLRKLSLAPFTQYNIVEVYLAIEALMCKIAFAIRYQK